MKKIANNSIKISGSIRRVLMAQVRLICKSEKMTKKQFYEEAIAEYVGKFDQLPSKEQMLEDSKKYMKASTK